MCTSAKPQHKLTVFNELLLLNYIHFCYRLLLSLLEFINVCYISLLLFHFTSTTNYELEIYKGVYNGKPQPMAVQISRSYFIDYLKTIWAVHWIVIYLTSVIQRLKRGYPVDKSQSTGQVILRPIELVSSALFKGGSHYQFIHNTVFSLSGGNR